MTEKEFEIKYQTYSQLLFNLAYAYVKVKEYAEDIVQETFLKYLKINNDFESIDHERNWLVRVCINKSKDFLKKNKKIVLNDDLVNSFISVDITFSRSEFINKLVMNLPLKYRVVVTLYYYEDFKIKDIARRLNVSESAVKMRLKRAKAMLMEMEAKYDK